MDSTLRVDAKGRLRMHGDGPFDPTFTIALAEAVLNLPPVAKHPADVTISDVLSRLTERSLKSFKAIVELDSKLRNRYQLLSETVAAIANPVAKTWAKLKLEDIVEEIFVDCAPVILVIFTTDGERFVSNSVDTYDDLLTFTEFEAKFGRTVQEHIEIAAKRKLRTLLRLRKLIKASPQTYTVGLVSSAGVVPERKLKVYSREQIELYAARNNATVTTIEKES